MVKDCPVDCSIDLNTVDWRMVKVTATLQTGFCEICKGVVDVNVRGICTEQSHCLDHEMAGVSKAIYVRIHRL